MPPILRTNRFQTEQVSSTEITNLVNLRNEKRSSQQVVPQGHVASKGIQQLTTQHATATTWSVSVWYWTVYHRLSAFVIFVNIGTIIPMCVKRDLANKPQACLQAMATCLLVSVLIRQDHVVNLLYHSFGLIPHSVPLHIRRRVAYLYELGGIHSGSAIAAGCWLIVFNVAVMISRGQNQHRDIQTILTLSLAGVLDILLLLMILSSLPVVRRGHHNMWEGTHRFSGWLLLAVLWAYWSYYMCLQSRRRHETHMPVWKIILANPVGYLLLAMSASISQPWLCRLRRVRPRYEKLSDHAIQLHFDAWHVSPCKTLRFSTRPDCEWHSFAGIPNLHNKGHSVIISRAGDWTSRMIDNPPEHLWTRGCPVQGVLYMAKIFKTVLCVGTGSGIAPILGLLEIPGTKFRVLWAARDPENTYSEAVIHRVRRSDADAIIIDSAVDGRPDLVVLASQIYSAGGIEAVFVISNEEVTRTTLRGLRAKEIPAYGPIFDS